MAPTRREDPARREEFDDTPTRLRACEMHRAMMSELGRRMDELDEKYGDHQRAIHGHNGDVGLQARMVRIEELFAESQSHRKWLIGILVAAVVNIAIAVVPLLFK